MSLHSRTNRAQGAQLQLQIMITLTIYAKLPPYCVNDRIQRALLCRETNLSSNKIIETIGTSHQ